MNIFDDEDETYDNWSHPDVELWNKEANVKIAECKSKGLPYEPWNDVYVSDTNLYGVPHIKSSHNHNFDSLNFN